MESAAVLRPFNCSVGAVSYVRSIIERPSMVAVYNASWTTLSKSHTKHSSIEGKLVSYPRKWTGTVVSCTQTSETAGAAESDVMSDIRPQGLLEKNSSRSATFPKGFEELVMNVCDKTQIAELKLKVLEIKGCCLKVKNYCSWIQFVARRSLTKVGDFELHLMRNIGATTAPIPGVSPTMPAAVPSKPMIESAPASPPATPPKSSTGKVSPFINVSKKSAKLSALEASGSSGYVLVSSPTVGSFRRGRTLKGKKQPPICKEGDVIKEGQVIGFLDQFGTELPVKSDVAGEVLKLLIEDGDAVGYGDALIAVLPSFHGIN